ncbi:ephrin-A1 isoform X1 [Loxodonta africana]|uniref:ephrin-A1 isoform X1 n=1 Tax=Loxodonta africana TaxID=9785 RepID=UPI000C811ED8|nr:ephrin-A1 isoform X1 [Loxodonta africana]
MEFFWAPLLGLCCSLAAADRHTVFWNSSNPKFWNDDYTVHVQLNDYLDIICPHYEDDSVAVAAMEQYTLYLVEGEEYQLCQPKSKDQVRWQCTQPRARHGPEKLSEKFQRFTPFTLGKEFKEGHSYYYICECLGDMHTSRHAGGRRRHDAYAWVYAWWGIKQQWVSPNPEILLFIHSYYKCAVSFYCVLGTLLGTTGTEISKILQSR